MKPALVRFAKKFIIDKEVTAAPFKKLYRDTYSAVVGNIKAEGFTNWNELLHNSVVVKDINEMLCEYVDRIFKRFRIDEFTDLDNRIFRAVPTNTSIKVEVVKATIQNSDDYQIAIYLNTDVMTLVGENINGLLLASGDKSNEVKSGIEFDVFSINTDDGYQITKFKTII